jgi:hypothetical protein
VSLRRLLLIGVAALLAVVGAFWLSSGRSLPRAVQQGEPVLPGLEAKLNEIAEIRIARGDGTAATLRRDPAGWRVVERDFPADSAQIRRLLTDLAALEVLEEKTSDPARYAQLEVDPVSGPAARGTLVTLSTDGRADGATQLILGKADGSRAVFVRPPASAISLLAKPQVVADAAPRRWLATRLLDIAADRVRRVSITARGEPTYIAERGGDGSGPLALTVIPPGREVADPAGVEALAAALVDLRLDDVVAPGASGAASLSSGAEARFETTDGLTIDLRERENGALRLITIEASGSTEAARAEAESINALVRGREFEIPAFKAGLLFRRLDELLRSR